MSGQAPTLSVQSLFADRDVLRRREREQDEQLKQRQAEELVVFRKRLEEFKFTPEARQIIVDRIKRAFERGETELILTSFPCSFCTDAGRTINNADAPPINKPDPNDQATKAALPAWLETLPAGARQIYDFWKIELEPGGFKFGARIIDFPGGMPGNVGLFFAWPKSSME